MHKRSKEQTPVKERRVECERATYDVKVFRGCIKDARDVLKAEGMMDMQSHVLSIALGLFRNRMTAHYRGGVF